MLPCPESDNIDLSVVPYHVFKNDRRQEICMVSQKMNFEKEPVIMPFNPKVNVLLSTYNGEKYLALQLKSLLEQTYQNMTIYVRDDGSEDNTRAILEHYRQKESETSTSRIVLVGDEKIPTLVIWKVSGRF